MAEAPAHRAAIDSYYLEERTFEPPKAFKRQALVTDTSLYDEAGAVAMALIHEKVNRAKQSL